jgi:hypothetical protein
LKAINELVQLAIGVPDARMLAQMLAPDIKHEDLYEAAAL